MKLALQQCVGGPQYTRYNFADDVYADRIVQDDVWDLQSRIIKCLGPLLLIVRLGDMKKGTLSKLKGTVDYVKSLMVETGDGSLEDKIAHIFHDNVGDLESDVASAAYVIDPQFVHKSKNVTIEVMNSGFLRICSFSKYKQQKVMIIIRKLGFISCQPFQ